MGRDGEVGYSLWEQMQELFLPWYLFNECYKEDAWRGIEPGCSLLSGAGALLQSVGTGERHLAERLG